MNNKVCCKQPFRYYGGKYNIAKYIVALMPKHCLYVEPFAGSAAVLFEKPVPPTSHYREVLNDLNEHIVNFFRVLQHEEQAKKLLRMIRNTPHAASEFQRARRLLTTPDVDPVHHAWAWYVAANMSYSGNPTAGLSRSKIPRDNLCFVKRYGRLKACMRRLKCVFIESLDAIECIRRYNTPYTLFYCDPPYVGADQGPYSGYTQQDFERLLEVLDTCSASFLLSTYENPAIPKHWECFEIPTLCHACWKPDRIPRPPRVELVFRVIRNHELPDHIRRLYGAGVYNCFTGESIRTAPGQPLVLNRNRITSESLPLFQGVCDDYSETPSITECTT